MSDCEGTDFVQESWTSPRKRKRKKHKKNIKHKNEIRVKTDDCIQKKKSKFKEAMKARNEKKKNKLSVGSDDSFIFTQGYSGVADPVYVTKPKTKASHHCSTEKLKPDHLTEEKIKRKQKAAYDLSPGHIRVKRPKFASSSTKQKDAVINIDSCSQVKVMGHSHCQPQDNDSQCTSDDMNSQDVFITQKTFKTLPFEHSSGEASDKSVIPTLQPLMQRERGQYSSKYSSKKKHLEELNTHLQESHFYQNPKMTKECLHSPKEVQTVLTTEKGSQQNLSKETWSCQRQMDLNKNLSEEKKISGPVHVKPTVVNFYLDDPIVVNCSKNVAKPGKHDNTASKQSASHPIVSTASIFTQTENFFTTELSSYLSFCQKSRVTECYENLKPLDLSLPQRARKNFGTCLSGIEVKVKEKMRSELKPSSLPGEIKGSGHKDPSLHPSDVEVKKEPFDWQLSVSAQRRGGTTLSPQSESEPKSADTTTSSEDNEPQSRTGKLDLTQVRAVQMRLNESFFFKTKGERQSPRPESPLMKLAQGRETKSIKAHRAPKEGCK